MTIRYATGDLDTPTRTVITVRDGLDATQGFSFLPVEVVKFGIIRIPSLGAVVAHADAAHPVVGARLVGAAARLGVLFPLALHVDSPLTSGCRGA